MQSLFLLMSSSKGSISHNLDLYDGLLAAFGGYAMVFIGLILLLGVVALIGKLLSGKKVSHLAETPAVAEVSVAPVFEPDTAPGTAGQLKLHDVPPKTAAMLMAIVADKMGKPLNELRFISIKEVK